MHGKVLAGNNSGQQIDTLSLALLAQGLVAQDKIGIYSNNMPQWTVYFASLPSSSCMVPIYLTNTAAQSSTLSRMWMYDLIWLRVVGCCQPSSRRVWTVLKSSSLCLLTSIPSRAQFYGVLARFYGVGWSSSTSWTWRSSWAAASMDDSLTLIYTSGTTGCTKA